MNNGTSVVRRPFHQGAKPPSELFIAAAAEAAARVAGRELREPVPRSAAVRPAGARAAEGEPPERVPGSAPGPSPPGTGTRWRKPSPDPER
jgi:hypothetical protein